MAKHHDPSLRATVMAALLAGQGVTEVARQYRLPKSTVQRWRKQARVEAGKSDEIGDLLMGYLRENLRTLTAQAIIFRDRSFVTRGSPEHAAILHGVLTDKAVRLLEALSDSPVDPEP